MRGSLYITFSIFFTILVKTDNIANQVKYLTKLVDLIDKLFWQN